MRTHGLVAAWTALLAAPLAWFALLQTDYALVQWACATGHTAVLRWLAAGAMAMVAGAVVLAWRALRAENGAAGAARFLASLGFSLGLLFLLVIVATLLPTFVLPPCR